MASLRYEIDDSLTNKYGKDDGHTAIIRTQEIRTKSNELNRHIEGVTVNVVVVGFAVGIFSDTKYPT